MPIGKEVIKWYIEKRVAIMQRHPNAVKKKKKKMPPILREMRRSHDKL